MVNRIDYQGWVKFVSKNLYDYVALETHPLSKALILLPDQFTGSRGDYIRKLFIDAIEELRPPDREYTPSQPEWRPYQILKQRFVDGISMQETAAALSISERQLRRDQLRALNALALRLWDMLQLEEEPEPETTKGENSPIQFQINIQRTDPREILDGVSTVLRRRIEDENKQLEVKAPPFLPMVLTDRVILRQILISLVNHTLPFATTAPIQIAAGESNTEVILQVVCDCPDNTTHPPVPGQDDLLDTVRYWARNINAHFHHTAQSLTPGMQKFVYTLELPKSDQKIILIVDDQEGAINLFRRYLARTDYQVMGETEPRQAVETANRLLPALITLDVMMPNIDGWELLQRLKLNDATRPIPVLVCSAWEEPELAKSLGAAGFIKKPVTQKMFLDELRRIGIL